MKHLILLSSVFAGLLFISACKKDTSAANKASGALPKSFTEDVTSSGLGHEVQTANLAYDGNGRLISLISVTSPGDKVLYQYNPDQTFTMDLFIASQLNVHALYWINANGYVDSCFQYNNTQDTSTTKFLYNGAKQLIQQKEFDYSTAGGSSLFSTDTYTYDDNGNVIQDVGDNETTTYDYYSDLLTSFSLNGIYFPTPKNLVKTMTIHAGGDPQTITHTYTFDGSKRLTVDSAVASDGGIDVKTYTY